MCIRDRRKINLWLTKSNIFKDRRFSYDSRSILHFAYYSAVHSTKICILHRVPHYHALPIIQSKSSHYMSASDQNIMNLSRCFLVVVGFFVVFFFGRVKKRTVMLRAVYIHSSKQMAVIGWPARARKVYYSTTILSASLPPPLLQHTHTLRQTTIWDLGFRV